MPCIANSQGALITDLNDIVDTFVDNFKALYEPIPAYNEQDLESLLYSLNIPVLYETDKNSLERWRSQRRKLKLLLEHYLPKIPRFRRFCIEWHRLHLKALVPRLRTLFHFCLENKILPDSLMEAQVVLLPKPGKDHLSCYSYRPIGSSQSGS